MEYLDILSIQQLHEIYGSAKPEHPLISVHDFSVLNRSNVKGIPLRMGLYSIACKKQVNGIMRYGQTSYDFTEGSLVFIAAGQIITPDPNMEISEGWIIHIHPDFFNATERGSKLTNFSFFGYETHEALHVSDSEKTILKECVANIKREISQNLDNHSHDLILSNLELLFAYCVRFHERQFLTRTKVSNDTLEKFERLLNDYFAQDSLMESGLPDVKYFSSRLNLSSNYLSDLLNKYTGKTTHEHIHLKLTDKAKSMLWSTQKTVSEIAYDLGFEHPSHFTKLFKSRTGVTPTEFRRQSA
jgi:AraC family transcriptional activator of pobA